jgi:hypothetical protein
MIQLVAGACYGRSESTLHPLPVRGERLSAFEPSEATGALGHSYVRVGKHGFDSPTGFGSQASLLEITFEGLALAA